MISCSLVLMGIDHPLVAIKNKQATLHHDMKDEWSVDQLMCTLMACPAAPGRQA